MNFRTSLLTVDTGRSAHLRFFPANSSDALSILFPVPDSVHLFSDNQTIPTEEIGNQVGMPNNKNSAMVDAKVIWVY